MWLSCSCLLPSSSSISFSISLKELSNILCCFFQLFEHCFKGFLCRLSLCIVLSFPTNLPEYFVLQMRHISRKGNHILHEKGLLFFVAFFAFFVCIIHQSTNLLLVFFFQNSCCWGNQFQKYFFPLKWLNKFIINRNWLSAFRTFNFFRFIWNCFMINFSIQCFQLFFVVQLLN